MHLKEGYRLHNGKYQLLNILGEGGFSLTYKGAWKTEVQGSLGKVPALVPVCIKEYFFKDYCLRNPYTNFVETNSATGKEIFEKYKEKIIKEARILSELHHPNVVNVLEVFKQNNTVYMVMEFISGYSLKQELENTGIFSEEKLIRIIFKIGQALQYIHEKNILHLDIKPSNILMDKNQNPQLIDFGISKRYDLSDQQETSTTIQAASKGYASIEQYDSEGTQSFSPCPDIYSLGATMYYLLTGQVPTESILRSTKGLQNPRELNPDISENTEKVILKAMEPNAADRYQTIMEMLDNLGYDPEKDQVDTSVLADKEEEKTEVLSRMQEQPYDADAEDETVLHPLQEETFDNIGKGKVALYLIPILFIVGLFILYIYGNMGSEPPEENRTKTNSNEIIYNKYFTAGMDNLQKRNLSQAREDILNALEAKETPEALSRLHEIDSMLKSVPVEQPDIKHTMPEVSQPGTPAVSVDTIQENYNKLFSRASTLFTNKDYKTAKNTFTEAATYKKTTEVEKYITLCDKELEKIEIEKRKEKYDLYMNFGIFVIAREKATGLFGAIDTKGYEKIPCKYKSQVLMGNNRYFSRSDDLYDIFSPSGELVREATSGD